MWLEWECVCEKVRVRSELVTDEAERERGCAARQIREEDEAGRLERRPSEECVCLSANDIQCGQHSIQSDLTVTLRSSDLEIRTSAHLYSFSSFHFQFLIYFFLFLLIASFIKSFVTYCLLT